MTTPSIPQKQCNVCKQWLPATTEYFHRRAKSSDGLGYTCKSCAIAREMKWRKDHPEQMHERNQAYYEEHAETIKARTKAWYRENTERARATIRKHYQENTAQYRANNRKWAKAHPDKIQAAQRKFKATKPERKREIARAYNKRNPEKMRVIRHKRWAAEHDAEGQFTPADIARIYDEQEGRCLYCGIPVFDEYHVDHIQPLSRAGTNWPDNLAITCPTCNMSKNNHMLVEWEGIRGW